jgi:ABC-type nickel/cobalt efflux system permease component RcnA
MGAVSHYFSNSQDFLNHIMEVNMEKLALGMSVVSFFYIILLVCYQYWQDAKNNVRKKSGSRSGAMQIVRSQQQQSDRLISTETEKRH